MEKLPPRYSATISLYVHANSLEEADEEAQKIASELDTKHDNKASVDSIVPSPFGRMRFADGGPISGKEKFGIVMQEFSDGTLTHGTTGDKVTDEKMAKAIAYSEARKIDPNNPDIRFEDGGEVQNKKYEKIRGWLDEYFSNQEHLGGLSHGNKSDTDYGKSWYSTIDSNSTFFAEPMSIRISDHPLGHNRMKQTIMINHLDSKELIVANLNLELGRHLKPPIELKEARKQFIKAHKDNKKAKKESSSFGRGRRELKAGGPTYGKVKEESKGGDCYVSAGGMVTRNKIDFEGTPHLVHGEVTGQGAIKGLKYGHAWVEDDIYVYDYSNNRELVVPKIVYYRIGNIADEKGKLYRYTFKEAMEKMVETENYGPWDLKTESGY